ncbi:MAG: glycine zipper 2TM domain-containing protein [Legionellales bacterium]|jgi:surface antigen|nr:glycine zipper 2TM domain-containing protein [Legionellales bacterium]
MEKKCRLKCSLIGSCVSVLLLVSCAEDISNRDLGTMTGGVIGGVLGAQFGKGDGQVAAAAAGAILGGVIGGNVGESMDELNRMKMAKVLENTKTNHSHSWVDPDSKAKYTVKPTKTIHKDNTVCRNYTMSVVVDGNLETAQGLACRNANGNWDIVN